MMKKPASFLMHKPQLTELGCGTIFKRMGTINTFGVEFDAGGKNFDETIEGASYQGHADQIG